jgi:hypothetical protein
MSNLFVRSILGFVLLTATVALVAPPAIAAEQGTKISIPDTAAGIWKSVDQHMLELKAVIAAGKLDQVHKHAYAVRDLVRALPAHSPGLSADAFAKVNANIPFVDTLAARLDQAGDAGDKAGTEANLVKFEAILKTIRSQYGTPQ